MKPYELIWCVALLVGLPLEAPANETIEATDLAAEAPKCTMPKARKPKFPIDRNVDAPTEIIADFNGDGWCDIALGVAYPMNSRMNNYYISELMRLGSKNKWLPVLNGQDPSSQQVYSLSNNEYVVFRPDMTDIALVYTKPPGAPFVVGLFNGHPIGSGARAGVDPCYAYRTVHRWDDEVGSFRRVDEATRKTVLEALDVQRGERCSR